MSNEESEIFIVRKSRVHGNGVFARREISKGEKIVEYVGEKITKDEAEKRGNEQLANSKNHKNGGGVYIFELNKKFDIDGNVSWNPARYINHSCEPNCEVVDEKGHLWIEAMRKIAEGEELNYDYGYGMDDFENHPCKCDGEKCIGFIVGARTRWRVRKRMLGKV